MIRRSIKVGLRVVAITLGLMGIAAAAIPAGSPVAGTVFGTGLMLGKFIVDGGGNHDAPRQLSKSQLADLSAWIDVHRSAFGWILASPPPPSYSVVFTDNDSRHIQLDLYSVNESWSHAVGMRIWDKSGKFIYGGQMSASDADLASLKDMLKPLP